MTVETSGHMRTCPLCGANVDRPRDKRPSGMARWYLRGDGERICWACIRRAEQNASRLHQTFDLGRVRRRLRLSDDDVVRERVSSNGAAMLIRPRAYWSAIAQGLPEATFDHIPGFRLFGVRVVTS